MAAYYNEIEPYAAAWLRNLAANGLIPPGDVDERDIRDVVPADLGGYDQCHFFAGLGGWPYALRRAGWDDSRPVWTGSCPCQPFSAAGQGDGFADERHLWPAFHHLIRERRPAIVFGEQVASRDAEPWVDLVCADMEALGYAFGAVPFPSAGVGAPHIRDRMYWVADARCGGDEPRCRPGEALRSTGPAEGAARERERRGTTLGDGGAPKQRSSARAREQGLRQRAGKLERPQCSGGMGVAPSGGWQGLGQEPAYGQLGQAGQEPGIGHNRAPGPTNGCWADADWILCRDGKWRPVEPGTFPLAHGVPARVGRLRAYGNAINTEAAEAFIAAFLDGAVAA